MLCPQLISTHKDKKLLKELPKKIKKLLNNCQKYKKTAKSKKDVQKDVVNGHRKVPVNKTLLLIITI